MTMKTFKLSELAEKLELEHDLLARFELDYWRNQADPILLEVLKSVPISHSGLGLITLSHLLGIGLDHKGIELIFPRSIINGHIAIMRDFSPFKDHRKAVRNMNVVTDLLIWLETITDTTFKLHVDVPIGEIQYIQLNRPDGEPQLFSPEMTRKAKMLYRLPESLFAYYTFREPYVQPKKT